MKPSPQRVLFDAPGTYRIRIAGHLAGYWAEVFAGMSICTRQRRGKPAITTLTGRLTDQASLVGILTALYDMGYTLLDVRRLPDRLPAEAASDEKPA